MARTVKLPKQDGEIRCPYPKCGGQVVEVDVAMRWNNLEVIDGAIHTDTSGDYDWEQRTEETGGDGFICDKCLRPVKFADEPDITYD